jgi:NAD(P)-dependent dehydrogenase (short-subunit alcohol dehydrogenase family)
MTATTGIEGRVALVTGANRGIGLALVEALLARGARKVYAAAREPGQLAGLVEAHGGRVVPIRLDITDAAQVQAAVQAAGDVDLLVNNAGVASHAFAAFDDSAWIDAGRREYDVNVLGTLRMSQAFAPVLARQGGGTVVNVVSVAALTSFPVLLSYSSSKAALHSITQATRQMLRGQGTGVIGVYPGPVDTDMAKELPLEKTAPNAVAHAILTGIERGDEEIYPDPTAVHIGAQYAASPKGLEREVGAVGAAA